VQAIGSHGQKRCIGPAVSVRLTGSSKTLGSPFARDGSASAPGAFVPVAGELCKPSDPGLREQRENLLADVVAVEDFDARDLAIHNVENQISGLGIQFHVLVPAAPPAMRWSSSVDGRTKVVAASTAIDKTKL